MTVTQLAAICHEANRMYCFALGDDSQPTWGDAPGWQRASAESGVMFHLRNSNAGPSGSHENWLKDKEADGWVYGEVKDADAKTHPCIVPFDALPMEQRLKDSLFVGIVHALAPLVQSRETE